MLPLNMENKQNNNKISLLPAEKGINVIKVTLEPRQGETECALLYLPRRSKDNPEGSQVKKHKHQDDEEVYVPLHKIKSDDYGFMRLEHKPQIAGKNSPTGQIEHGIEPSNEPQVYLAIKRNSQPHAWQDFTNNSTHQFLSGLNFAVGDWYDEKTMETKGLEFNLLERSKNGFESKVGVRIDFNSNKVIYVDRRKAEVVREENTLNELKNPQKDFGIEM